MIKQVLIVAILLAASDLLLGAAITHTGQVIAITDGDTIKILSPAKQQIKIRLAEIDTPEKRQPYGKKAKQVLSNKVFGKQVKVVKVPPTATIA